MINKLELHHLRTLDALYKQGTLSAAAEQLGVSQQAVSQQLKTLRALLSDDLFVRTGQGMMPTPYARMLEPYLERVLIALNGLPLPDSINPETIERTLVISATDYTQEVIVSRLIRELSTAAPGVRLVVTNVESAGLTRKMQQGDIDLVFTSEGYVPDGLVPEPLFTEQYRLVASNPALARPDPLPLDRLVTRGFVITSPGTGSLKGSADSWFERQGLQRRVVVSAPSFHIASQCLKHSDLVAFLPARLLPIDGLFEVPLQKSPPGFQVVSAYHPSAKNDPLILWLLDLLKQRFSRT